MGNEQPKKMGKANKSQIQMASMKAKIHLELMRDRKNNDIIKGEKELVNKLKAASRNRTQEVLIMERVVNGLKYSQAVNQLIAYATSLKGQAGFLAENVGNHEKLAPWLPQVHTLLFAADHLGLSSLNQFKMVMKALNNPMEAEQYINPQIKSLLAPTPTPYEINIYVLEMVQRNGLSLELVNSAGHQFKSDPDPPGMESRKSFTDIEKQLAQQFQKNIPSNNGNQGFGGNQGFNPGGNQGYGGNQGFGGGNPGLGGNQGYGGGNQGLGGNQGFGSNQGFGGNGGGFNANNGVNGTGGFGNPNGSKTQSYGSNPYEGTSHLNDGPQYYNPSNIQPSNSKQKPHEFKSFDSLIKDPEQPRNTVNPIYPSVNPNQYQNSNPYNPTASFSKPENEQKNPDTKSPTISQIMKDFDLK